MANARFADGGIIYVGEDGDGNCHFADGQPFLYLAEAEAEVAITTIRDFMGINSKRDFIAINEKRDFWKFL